MFPPCLQVVATVGDTHTTYEPTLLVGADGLNSAVRQALEKWDPSGRCAGELSGFVILMVCNPCMTA
jgi:2-polyprenyl-6-methoxyphenol hydroxylase-like FAD-dependent oxidoreductase